ncbi:FAD binding domain-containing protein [Aestuariivirga sp.]|uniref:FAD binding domain-containing protein n=1 Tax=Aestuariivirga sp. TaxID=2650926 RepID=UPI003BAC4B0A
MKSFEYTRASSVSEAVAAWQPGSAFLAGGTNLLDLMKTGAKEPGQLIDISRLAELDRIELMGDGALRIGALMKNSDLASDPHVTDSLPLIAEALLSGASGQIRNAATVAGNLLQHTRCAYFQDPFSPCNRRTPGSGCAARDGVNENLAILGWSEDCIATNPSDFAVALAALDASVEVRGPHTVRIIPVDRFYSLPGDTPERETVLEPGELVTAITVPAASAAFSRHSRYLKVRERTSFAFALVSAAAALTLENGKITGARLALGSVAAMPWRRAEAEAALIGQVPGQDAFARAATMLLKEARPSGDNAYKIDLAGRTIIRALAIAAAGTPDRVPALPASPFGALAHV